MPRPRSVLLAAFLGGLLASSATVPAAAGQDLSLARTDRGVVHGVATTAGRAFLAIPYAAPPVGDLRWRAPRPAAAWVASTGVVQKTITVGAGDGRPQGWLNVLGGASQVTDLRWGVHADSSAADPLTIHVRTGRPLGWSGISSREHPNRTWDLLPLPIRGR